MWLRDKVWTVVEYVLIPTGSKTLQVAAVVPARLQVCSGTNASLVSCAYLPGPYVPYSYLKHQIEIRDSCKVQRRTVEYPWQYQVDPFITVFSVQASPMVVAHGCASTTEPTKPPPRNPIGMNRSNIVCTGAAVELMLAEADI